MWFKFPPGTNQISIEQQNFVAEADDADGNKLFRAPDHFAPTILGLSGFGRGEPPEGAPPDLPKADPKRANEIEQLSAELESSRAENQRLRQELGAARRERDELQTKLDDLKSEATTKEAETLKKPATPPTPPTEMVKPPAVAAPPAPSTSSSGKVAAEVSLDKL